MHLPSKKLNSFKKVKYLLTIDKLNERFKNQYQILLHDREKLIELNKKPKLPTWEIEKKILFWTYASNPKIGQDLKIDDFLTEVELYRFRNVKSLESSLNPNLKEETEKIKNSPKTILKQELNDMRNMFEEASSAEREKIYNSFKENIDLISKNQRTTKLNQALISQNEILNAGILNVLNNMTALGFLRKTEKEKFKITKKALKFGEILWYAYHPKLLPETVSYVHIYGRAPYMINREKEIMICNLKKDMFVNFFIQKTLLIAFYSSLTLFLFIVPFIFIDLIGLSSEIKEFISNSRIVYYKDVKIIFIILLFIPFITVLIHLISNFFHEKIRMQHKTKKVIEKINELKKDET